MNLWLRIFLPFALGYFLSYLLRNANAVIAPELVREFGVSAADLGLLTSAYLLAFAAFQLPLGILLDRHGPRRVEATLLIIAGCGCMVFALGGDIEHLAGGRALIGLGVSACLMAAFKAFSLWFPLERQPALNAAVMAAGALGALTATTPLAAVLPLVGRRGIFIFLALLAGLAAAGIFTTPDKPGSGSAGTRETLRAQLSGLAGVLRSRVFWRFAPQTAAIVGGFMAIQGLWAVPWLMKVNGASRDAAAFHLLLTSVAMLSGFLAIAFLVTPLARRGTPPQRILRLGMGGGLLVMALIVLDVGATHVLWFALGLVFSTGNLAYPLLSANFPAQLSGRVNTALNLTAFVAAFGLQWGIGVLVSTFVNHGLTEAQALRWSLGGLCLLQAASHAWFVLGERPAR